MSEYLVDTVAFVRYLEDRLPSEPDRIFQEAEAGHNHLFLPQIALAEFIYLTLKGRLRIGHPAVQIREILHNLEASDAFTVTDMPPPAWETFLELGIPEMHDRLLAAEAVVRDVPIVSNDRSFDRVDHLVRIW